MGWVEMGWVGLGRRIFDLPNVGLGTYFWQPNQPNQPNNPLGQGNPSGGSYRAGTLFLRINLRTQVLSTRRYFLHKIIALIYVLILRLRITQYTTSYLS